MATQAKINFQALGDVKLAGLCAARDCDAIRHIITANNQRMFRTAWSILKDRAESEEAVQAAYLSAFSKIGSFEGRSSLATWLTRIIVNEALGRLRANRRRRAARALSLRTVSKYPQLMSAMGGKLPLHWIDCRRTAEERHGPDRNHSWLLNLHRRSAGPILLLQIRGA